MRLVRTWEQERQRHRGVNVNEEMEGNRKALEKEGKGEREKEINSILRERLLDKIRIRNIRVFNVQNPYK